MARPLRKQIQDGLYHVMSRGTDRRVIFTDDRERRHFLELLEKLVERYRFIVHAYVLMENHYHLIVQTPEGNLSAGMQWLNTSYSMWFNRRHERVGPLLQGRYKSVCIESSGWAYDVGVYIHLNPVRIKAHGLDKRARKENASGRISEPPNLEEVDARLRLLRNYRWSSYRSYAGYERAPEWLEMGELLSRKSGGASACALYREELCKLVKEGIVESLAERLQDKVALGSEEFKQMIKRLIREGGREYAHKRESRSRCAFENVVCVVEELKAEKWEDFQGQRGDWGKGLVLWGARRFSGLTLAQIGQKADGMDYTAVAMAIKRFEVRAAKNLDLRRYQKRVRDRCDNCEK